jgi:Xaa-Pro aminopeptidase
MGECAAVRLAHVRQAMRSHGVDACLIPSADPHLSEYLPAHWQIRAWLTGFTGSVGTVVVTQDHATLWVDSRYWVQAERELEATGFTLKKLGSSQDGGYLDWLGSLLKPGDTLAVDGRTLSLQAHDAILSQMGADIRYRLDIDLPGQVWADRPALPSEPITTVPAHLCGLTRAQKLARVRESMHTVGTTHHVVSSLDDIAWLMNLRGSDVAFNPVFLAHVLIGPNRATLFVERTKLSEQQMTELDTDGVDLADYGQAAHAIQALSPADALLVDPQRTTYALVDATAARVIRAINPSTLMKACKMPLELEHWREVMVADGQALCEFFAWLESALATREGTVLTELMIDEALTQVRASRAGYVSPSFATIAAFNANGAMPHYRATPESHARIHGDGLLLIDSGAQYLGGTTDITRMVPVGEPSFAQKADCTAVLQGMIAMSMLQFPRGIQAPLLDAVARAPLWALGLDYGHGTGHGVGYYLNVHEGPQVLSYRVAPNPNMALQAGMVTSNEPGVYRPGQWGVRIENLLACQSVANHGFGEFLAFETLTLCPIDTRCLLPEQLRPDEVQWLNNYHARVRAALRDGLHSRALDWLLARTESLPL